jgi:flagellar basal-body rod modification protein FlgD
MQVTSSTSSTALLGSSTASTSSSSNSTLNESQFLQLLTVQLENQDPLQPMDDTAFLAQMAQFTSLQETNTMNQQVERLTAASYIGSTVTVNPGNTAPVTGQVTAVDTSGADPELVINGAEYPIAELQMVSGAQVAASTSSTAASSGTTAASTPSSTPAATANAGAAVSVSAKTTAK